MVGVPVAVVLQAAQRQRNEAQQVRRDDSVGAQGLGGQIAAQAVQVAGKQRGLIQVQTLDGQPGDHPSEHVARAARGQGVVAGAIQQHLAGAGKDHAGRALEHDGEFVLCRQLQGGLQALARQGQGIAAGQPVKFRGMGCETKIGLTLGQQFQLAAESVQAVGVQHHGHGGLADQFAHQRAGLLRATQAGTHHQDVRPLQGLQQTLQSLLAGLGGQGQGHYLGHVASDLADHFLVAGQPRQPGAAAQHGPRAEQGRARHARRTSEQQDLAEVALMAAGRAGRDQGGEFVLLGVGPGLALQQQLHAVADVHHRQLAREIPAGRQEQTPLGRSHGQGGLGLDHHAGDFARVGVHAGGHVDGPDGHVAVGDGRDQPLDDAPGRALGTGAEQGVDDQVRLPQVGQVAFRFQIDDSQLHALDHATHHGGVATQERAGHGGQHQHVKAGVG